MTLNDEQNRLLRRAKDALSISENKYMIKSVGFLTPFEAEFLKRNIKAPMGVSVRYIGGYAEAERTLFTVVPEYLEDEADNEIAVLLAEARNLSQMTHRDFLGSLMGLGIKRETIGDILVYEDKCLIFVRREMADYIVSNLTKIGRDGINITVCDVKDVDVAPKKTEEISGTVSSARLDAVLSLALKTSRAKAAELITGGAVSLNWNEELSVSKSVCEGDVLSVKRFGRFKVGSIGDLTKKGRYKAVILKYV